MVETMKAFTAAYPYVIAPKSDDPDPDNSKVLDYPLHDQGVQPYWWAGTM